MKLKNKTLIGYAAAIAASILLAGSTAPAATWTIEDNYVGKYYKGDGWDYSHNDGDVISLSGHENNYDIDNMVVDIDSLGNITVTIQTDFNNSGDIDYGDLFISTTGWAPGGDAPYALDTYRNGNGSFITNDTDWGYVFDTDTLNFYSTSRGTFKMSQSLTSGNSNYYRKHQIVQFDANRHTTLITSQGVFDTSQDGFLIYSGFNLSDLGGLSLDQDFELAFRWAMTCANDAIEGSIEWQAVPEPGTMVLFGIGLLGLAVAGRKTLVPVSRRS